MPPSWGVSSLVSGLDPQGPEPSEREKRVVQQILQQGRASGEFQRPEPNSEAASSATNEMSRHNYNRTPLSISDYAQQQTQIAENGASPPNITPTPTTIDPSFRPPPVQQPQPQPQSSTTYQSTMSQNQASSSNLPQQPGQQPASQLPVEQRTLRQIAEEMAFTIDPETGLNCWGVPQGYMPANLVTELNAWDKEGNTLWVPEHYGQQPPAEQAGAVQDSDVQQTGEAETKDHAG